MKTRFVFSAFVAALLVIVVVWWRFRTADQQRYEDPTQNIQWLTAGTPEKQVDRAYSRLVAAGPTAFPALIKNLENRTPADDRFQRAVVEVRPDGSRHPYTPTVGNVCFDILQLQIEGSWPKSMAAYSVVSIQWIREHASRTLTELQEIAIAESLRRAKAKGDERAVEFFEKRRGEVRR